MKSIRKISLDDGSVVLVEMEEVDAATISDGVAENADLGLRRGATPVSAVDKVTDTVKSLQGTLRGVVEIVHTALKESSPAEWGVELNIGFKGTTNPIPIIVSGEASASLKIHAKWKKSYQKSDS